MENNPQYLRVEILRVNDVKDRGFQAINYAYVLSSRTCEAVPVEDDVKYDVKYYLLRI
jgi:hypothetical protein